MAGKQSPRKQKQQKGAEPVFFSLLLGFLAQLSFTLDVSVLGGVLLYLIAGYIFARSLRENETKDGTVFHRSHQWSMVGALSPGTNKWLEGSLLLGLLLLASFFRLYRIDSQPSSLWLDEALTGLNALEIIEGKNAPLWEMTPLDRWRPDWVKTSNLYLYYVVLVFKVFGSGYFGLKMVSLLPAIASVVVVYFLLKEISSVAIAFLAAFLTAVSQWHVTISRWGWDAVLMCFLQLVSYWLLIRGLKTGRRFHFAASGVLMGLCLYTYLASWIAFGIALTFLLLRAAREPHALRASLQDGGLFLLSCLLVFAPLGAHYLNHPGDLIVRAAELNLTKAVEEARSYYPVWENIRSHALMFNYKGDSNARHAFPEEPVLDFVTAIFFVLGLVYYVRFWKSSHNLFVLLWFALGMQGGLLADPSASPHAYRTFMVSPVACFFAGISVHCFLGACWRSLPNLRYKEVTALILGITLLGTTAFINYRTYFVRRPKSRAVWEEESRDGRLPVKIQLLQKESSLILMDPILLWKIVVLNSWFLTYQPGKLFQHPYLPANVLMAETKLSRVSDEDQVVYVFSPLLVRLMQTLFPDAQSELVFDPSGEPLYGLLKITVSNLRTRLQSVDGKRLASAIHGIALLYEKQLAGDAEIGPRRKFLLEESQTGLDLVRKFDPGVRSGQ